VTVEHLVPHPAPLGDPRADDEADIEAAVTLATRLLAAAREVTAHEHGPSGRELRAARRRAERLSRMFGDEAGMAFSLAITDQVARITDPARAARRLRDLVAAGGPPRFLGPLDRAALRVGARLAGPAQRLELLARVLVAGVGWRLRRESAGVVLPAEDPAFTRYVERRRGAGVRLNVNVLGEAILGDDEARRRLDEVMARIDRADVDYVSVKVSSVCAQLSSLAFDTSVDRIAERLRLLFRRAAAAEPPVFVNLDMEEHRDLAMTLAVFMRVLDEPAFAGLDAGIALQAYLPEPHDAFEQVAAWARRRHEAGGGRIKVRLVKGANLAMERVDAELHGWPQAPYPTKADVDASYKRLLDRALDPGWGDAVRVGLASHNLFDVSWGLVRAERWGTSDRLDLEMLEGMAPSEAEALRRLLAPHGREVLLYAPVVRHDEFDAAIAYLVRRLDENTGPENFLRHQFALEPGSDVFAEQRDRFAAAVRARHDVDATSRRIQDRANETRVPDHMLDATLDEPFANEPDTDWSSARNRAWLARQLAAPPALPDPPAPAGHEAVDRVVATARAAQVRWAATPARERARLLLRVAEVLAARRGEALAVMASDAGKTVGQGDPEVSEAIDFARWYARQALRLDELGADHAPIGPVVVAPPWNFPLAIPAGGVLAALAAGSTVILKPAPEAVRTAWWLAHCLWDAGLPPDVVSFLPCPDGPIGRHLITHDGVGAVILTGSADTARRFLAWKPHLWLQAETSGKNAMVVTAAADLDQAVKDLVTSAFGHAGQKCSAASLAIVEQSVLDDGRFLAKLADATRSLRVGPATDPSVDVGPLIGPPNERLARALQARDGQPAGERWLVAPRCLDPAMHLWSPGIRVGVAPGSFLHRTELFGPVLAARDLDHAIELQNATEFGLTGGLQSLDPAEIDRWLARVEVGNAYVNRTTTGAIVRRQPFGGWKRSVVGPAAKAGGPDYVVSLCQWTDRAGDRRSRAEASYAATWPGLSRPDDPTALRAEHNEHRHVPLPSVVLRVEDGADPLDVDLCLLAARTTGTPVRVSRSGDEPIARLVAGWSNAGPSGRGSGAAPPARLRVLGPVPDRLRRAAIDAWVPLDDRRPVAEGRVELPRWCREQSVSVTAHRHGNTRVG
jgi:RHH-type proline utilization regulon transcriptional repressor/proline dehydrogenase/delta 1-pyrroline-5-carboxylate dehydrogenase